MVEFPVFAYLMVEYGKYVMVEFPVFEYLMVE